MKKSALILSLWVVFFASSALAQWNTQMINQSGNCGVASKIVLDVDGFPHAVYIQNNNTVLYSKWNGTGWQHEVVEAAGASTIFHDVAIAISSQGIVFVATINYNSPNDYVRFAVWKRLGPSSWYGSPSNKRYNYESGGVFRVSACLHDGFFDVVFSKHDLHYARFNEGLALVSSSVIDPSGAIQYGCAITHDANGSLHVSYFEVSSGDLKYAYYDGTWSTQYIDTEGNVGKYNSIVIRNGKPNIFYYDETNGDLKHAVLE